MNDSNEPEDMIVPTTCDEQEIEELREIAKDAIDKNKQVFQRLAEI